MRVVTLAMIGKLLEDPAHGWSIGCLGALAEFSRDAGEPVRFDYAADHVSLCTPRGALSVADRALLSIAWDGLSSDGRGWNHTLAFCLGRPRTDQHGITPLGHDRRAVRPEDREASLFDLGVGCGFTRMCVRTSDPALIGVLTRSQGDVLLEPSSATAAIFEAQPHRVMLSPAARIEVFQSIPAPDGTSPEGPHTHLLPRLLATNRAHSANDPIPPGLQSALTFHPRPPWQRRDDGLKVYDKESDEAFTGMLAQFGLKTDVAVERAVMSAVRSGQGPYSQPWPSTRRARAKARITLRRLAVLDEAEVSDWRRIYDRRGGPATSQDDVNA